MNADAWTDQEQDFVEAAARALRIYTCGRLGHIDNEFGIGPWDVVPKESELRTATRVLANAGFVACKFLGMLEQANGCSLNTIILAAGSNVDAPWSRSDVVEFAVALTLEAVDPSLASTFGWTAEHPAFDVPSRFCGKCDHADPHDREQAHDNGSTRGYCRLDLCQCVGFDRRRPFVIPSIVIFAASQEEAEA